jgi:DNA-binding Xre family transcriptional regulator
MQERGMTAYALAKAVRATKGDVSEATIYRIVRDGGKVDSVRLATLEALALAFDCKVGDLFARGKR